MYETVGNAMKWWPQGAIGLTIGGGANSWGAWTQLLAATSADSVLAGMSAMGVHDPYSIQVGMGAAGQEVPVAQIDFVTSSTSGGAGDYGWFPFEFPFDCVPSGTRVALRVRCNATSARNAYRLAVAYWEKPLVLSIAGLTVTTQQLRQRSAYVAMTKPGSWNPGPWVEIMSAAAADLFAVGIHNINAFGLNDPQGRAWEVGVGAAGAEVVKTMLSDCAIYTYYYGVVVPVSAPLPTAMACAGERVSLRMRGTSAESGSASLDYYEAPL